MGIKITSSPIKIFGPFAVFAIIITIAKIVSLIGQGFVGYGNIVMNIGFFVGSVGGLIYTLTSLRYLYRIGGLDRFVYFAIASVFVVLAIFAAISR